MVSIISKMENTFVQKLFALRKKLGASNKRTVERATLQWEDAQLLEEELPFHCLMAYVALAFEHFEAGDVEKAFETLLDGETKFKALGKNAHIHTFSDAFEHVLKAAKSAFLHKKGDVDQALEIVSSIGKLSEMNNGNQVALMHGFPAVFIGSFGSLDGTRLGLDLLSTAIESDPTEPIWYYTKAAFTGQLDCGERLIDKMPSDEEYALLEKASKLRRAAIFSSLAGNLYRQSAKELSRPVRILGSRSKNDDYKIRQFNKKSYELYCESLQLNANCPETMIRCARGFILLPVPHQDLLRGHELVTKALELVPGSRFGHQVLAEYYKAVHDPEAAIKTYELCEKKKMYGATMARIRLQYHIGGQKIDFIKRHEDLLDVYEGELEQVQILNELTTYCILVLKDMRKACSYAEKLLEHGCIGNFVMQCRPSGAFCTTGFSEVTLYELLIAKIKSLPLDGNREEQQYYLRFLDKLLARKIVPADPKQKEDTVTFSRASSKFSFFRVTANEADTVWRRNASSVEPSSSSPSSKPVLSWRRQMAGPPTAKQNMKVKVIEPRGTVRTETVNCRADMTNRMRAMNLEPNKQPSSSK